MARRAAASSATASTKSSGRVALTDREREILDLVALGLGNQAIGRKLSLAPKTVRNNVSTILGKLHVADRAEAIARARRHVLGGWN